MTDPEPASPSSPGSGSGSASASASGPAGASGGRQKWVVFLIVAVLSLVADQATKVWARDSLPTARFDHSKALCIVPDDMMARRDASGSDRPPVCRGEQVGVINGYWEWRLSVNPGSAVGLFSSQNGARGGVWVLGIVAGFGLVWGLRKGRPGQKNLHWA